jgi:hypothetical protein
VSGDWADAGLVLLNGRARRNETAATVLDWEGILSLREGERDAGRKISWFSGGRKKGGWNLRRDWLLLRGFRYTPAQEGTTDAKPAHQISQKEPTLLFPGEFGCRSSGVGVVLLRHILDHAPHRGR